MKRSCFALSILMASLSGSLLWGDAATSRNRGSVAAVAPREAAPRPPRVDDDCFASCDWQEYDCGLSCDQSEYDCPSRAQDYAYDDFDCGYSSLVYDTCSYDASLHGACAAELHPTDLPHGITCFTGPVESASEDCDIAEVNPLFLSHYDPVYDAAVYGVDVYLSEEIAYPVSESDSYAHETFDYEAYSDCYDDRYSCRGYDYGYDDDPAQVAVEEELPQLYGHYYEYQYDYEYNYDYEYDYDYQYEYDANDRAERDSAGLDPGDLRIVIAHLRDFAGHSLNQCEPLQATLEAGCKIVAWSSGFDPSHLWNAARAEIAEAPSGDDRQTR